MKKIHLKAAGIDIGAKHVFVSTEDGEVHSYETFTSSFHVLKGDLLAKGVKTVAMEATGSYWFILYDILLEAGLDTWLVDGRQTRQVPGRKTDVKDCQWIQQLHSHGLLNRCHVPEGLIKSLRSYQRLREDHIESAAMHVRHMQKALLHMNIRLKEVISQVHGKSGMRIIEAILAGERDRHKLLSLCHSRIIENKSEQVLKSLEGFYQEEHLFALQQAYNSYHFYQNQIRECDGKIEEVLKKVNKKKQSNKNPGTRKPIRHHQPNVSNLGQHMITAYSGKDATILPGFTDYTTLQLLSEVGNDLGKWKTEKHFTSWCGLSPGQHHSGKTKKSRRKKGKPKAGQIFRVRAQSLLNSKKTALGAFGRRLRSRKGAAIAIKAVARKLAEMFWRLMVKGSSYVERGVEHYEQLLLKNKVKYFNKLAKELNMKTNTSP